jgi:hypothetical protein
MDIFHRDRFSSEISTIKSPAILSSFYRSSAILQDSGILNTACALNKVSPDIAPLAQIVKLW